MPIIPRGIAQPTSGKLRSKIKIERLQRIGDGIGGFESTWVTFIETYAWIDPIRGWEEYEAVQLQPRKIVRFFVRYRSGISTDMRLVYQNRIFQIKWTIDKDERHNWLELLCEEGAAA